MLPIKAQIFIEPPEDFQKKIEVATCYIRSNDEILFLQRHLAKSQGGLWGVPGGKVEQGRDVESEMIREILEETSIDLSRLPIETLGSVYIRYPDIDFLYHMFGVILGGVRPEIVLNPEEHIAYDWCTLQIGLRKPLILLEEACTFLVWNNPIFNGCIKPELNSTHKDMEFI